MPAFIEPAQFISSHCRRHIESLFLKPQMKAEKRWFLIKTGWQAFEYPSHRRLSGANGTRRPSLGKARGTLESQPAQ
jgi:hypothetical protein